MGYYVGVKNPIFKEFLLQNFLSDNFKFKNHDKDVSPAQGNRKTKEIHQNINIH